MNGSLNIRVAAREMYERGNGSGVWLKLPATAAQFAAALARIGAQDKDFVISDFESNIAAVSRFQLEHVQKAGLDELNCLAARLESFDDKQIDKFNNIAGTAPYTGDIHYYLELAHNMDFYTLYADINNHAELGEYVFRNSGLIQIPDVWSAAVDREKLGEFVAENEGGVFTEQGYIVRSNVEREPVNEIPKKYHIAPKPDNY
jgi:hypothetical protein